MAAKCPLRPTVRDRRRLRPSLVVERSARAARLVPQLYTNEWRTAAVTRATLRRRPFPDQLYPAHSYPPLVAAKHHDAAQRTRVGVALSAVEAVGRKVEAVREKMASLDAPFMWLLAYRKPPKYLSEAQPL